jgi:hypothetical protein
MNVVFKAKYYFYSGPFETRKWASSLEKFL